MAKTRNVTISVTPEIKSLLTGIKIQISQKRRVTWSETLEILASSFAVQENAKEEAQRLHGTIEQIALNQSKGTVVVTQNLLNAPIVPPPPTHLCPPPRGTDTRQDHYRAVMAEMETMFAENDGRPKLVSAESAKKAREAEKQQELVTLKDHAKALARPRCSTKQKRGASN